MPSLTKWAIGVPRQAGAPSIWEISADMRTALTSAIMAAILAVFVALAAWQWMTFSRHGPLGSDYFVYTIAINKAWQASDPYLPHSIGWGYLYPPPSLLLVKASALLARPGISPTAVWIGAGVLAVCASLVILAGGRLCWWRACVALLLLTSAGLVESTMVGQINGLVVLGVVTFFVAWRAERPGVACVALAIAICLKATPIVFAALFLKRDHIKWLLPLGASVAGLLLLAQLIIPAGHLAQSYLDAFRWAASPERIQNLTEAYNYSLSVALPKLLFRLGGTLTPTTWDALHWGKLTLLTVVLGAACVGYVKDGHCHSTRDTLFVVCNVCMVLAPNMVWLHHAALLIPAFWFLLAESNSRAVVGLAMIALLCFQCTRWLPSYTGVEPAFVFGLGQVVLLGATLLYANVTSEIVGLQSGISRPLKRRTLPHG